MADEIPIETQAMLDLKLKDHVRELIRNEILEAYADPGFTHELMLRSQHTLTPALADQITREWVFKGTVESIAREACKKVHHG